MCTMDIGIRTANVALAYTLFHNMGLGFSDSEVEIFSNCIYDHCYHIRHNLEWSDTLTGNHYYADVAGLLFGSAILPDCEEKWKWIKFASRELQRETLKQFHREGTNAEGSSAYHRLTSEMAVYSLALVENLANRGLCSHVNKKVWSIIEKSGQFIADITKPDGTFTQIGDNDSGLFFRLSITGDLITPAIAMNRYLSLGSYEPERGDAYYLDENMNDGRTFCSAAYGLFGLEALESYSESYPLESEIIRMVAGLQGKYEKPRKIVKNVPYAVNRRVFPIDGLSHKSTKIVESSKCLFTKNLKHIAYPEFGVYIYRSDFLYLCICCADNGQKGNGGHVHNDKLSIELVINGNIYFEDPVTYVYTSSQKSRNQYRSVLCHNTINAGKEQNDIISMWSIKNETKCECILWEDNEARFIARYKNIIHRRDIRIEEHKITVDDYCNRPFKAQWNHDNITAGYGKLKR